MKTLKNETISETEKVNKRVVDKHFAKIEFTDPDTGECLISDFKLWQWYKAPSHIERDINERLMNPIVTVAGRKSHLLFK